MKYQVNRLTGLWAKHKQTLNTDTGEELVRMLFRGAVVELDPGYLSNTWVWVRYGKLEGYVAWPHLSPYQSWWTVRPGARSALLALSLLLVFMVGLLLILRGGRS